VGQISDRAKRYRAHSPGCEPSGPRKCFKCGSRRNVVPDHIDGDESNGRRSNLRWACKRHNTILGKKMAKAGKGVRTRQYNPAPDKIAGHEGWKQLMASKLAQKYDGLRRSGMSRDEALRETLRSTTAGPGSIALFKKLAKNPGAINLAQYVQAAVDHTRKAHDAGGKVIHETPKAKRREFAREIAFRKGYRSNPSIMELGGNRFSVDNGHGTTLLLKPTSWGGWEVQATNARTQAAYGNRGFPGVHTFNTLAEVEARYKGFRGISKAIQKNPRKPFDWRIADLRKHMAGFLKQKSGSARRARYHEFDYMPGGTKSVRKRANPTPADDLYRKFHGRGPDKILTSLIAGVDPYGGHPQLSSLGPCIRLIVGEGVKLGGAFGDEAQDAEWVKEIAFVPDVKKWHRWLETENPSVSRAKGYLETMRVPDLAAVPNTKMLYLVGGNQNVDADLKLLGADPEKDILDLGNVYLVEYFTQKRFDRFEPTNYWHHFGEKTGVQPRLMYLRGAHLLWLAGGEYVVTPRGIEN
jgi:hypothetical protein